MNLRNIFKRKPEAPAIHVSGDHSPMGHYMPGLQVPWSVGGTRKRIEQDIEAMDSGDGLVARNFDKIGNYATCWDEDQTEYGFKIETAEAPGEKPSAEQIKAVGILEELADRTEINGLNTWDRVRSTAKRGNIFTELAYSNDFHIEAVLPFCPSWVIEKNVDRSGRLKSGDPALALKDPKQAKECAYTQIDEAGKIVAAFYPFQIDHFRFGPTEGGVYATPLMESLRTNWKRLMAQLDSIGIARVTRAWETNVHRVLVPVGASQKEVDDKLKAYKEAMESDKISTYDASSGNFQTTPRYSPMDVARDHYILGYYTQDGKMIEGSIDKLNADTSAFRDVDDILLAMAYLITGMNIPMDIVGLELGQKSFVDKGNEEGMKDFNKFIRRLQASDEEGLRRMFDIELLLSGMDPRKDLYRIVYPRVIPQTAETEAKVIMSKGQTATYWYGMGVPPELIGPMIGLDPNAVKLWRAELEKQIAAQKELELALQKQAAKTPQQTKQNKALQQPKPKDK